MNNILELRGRFNPRKHPPTLFTVNIPKDGEISKKHIKELINNLKEIVKEWKDNVYFDEYVILSVHYRKIVAKSNRINSLFFNGNEKKKNSSIIGSRFEGENDNRKHVFTYYVLKKDIEETIEKLENVLSHFTKESLTYDYIEKLDRKTAQILVDSYYVESFKIDDNSKETKKDAVVTIYKTNKDVISLFEKIGIKLSNDDIIDDVTIRLTPTQLYRLKKVAPYLIATQVNDFSKIPPLINYDEDYNSIFPDPKNEPVIGVIDTHFDKTVSFSKWVEYENRMDKTISIDPEDKVHGTAVSSIIVNGPAFNPELEDECGMFRVKLFGVSKHDGFSWFSLYKNIVDIVNENPKIKVWNLSLGSDIEIDSNYISPIGALLDRLQNEKDIVFIVAGTNKPFLKSDITKIGAPADSLNSIVVNSVKQNRESASYTREGPVLSFFHKPDISYFGGDINEGITIGTPMGKRYASGTSFAAPWIARKMAYLIYIVGLTKETAKALLIDSAADWEVNSDDINRKGYGIVPIKISDILSSKDDEIRFIINGKTDNYQMYNYDLPVPIKNNKYYYFAKATLCYYPYCDRNQGVDYTTGEMSIKFGRMRVKDNKPFIQAIDNNRQEDSNIGTLEKDARELFRKWDNVKHINTGISDRARPKDTFEQNKWGITITTKDRITVGQNRGLNFGIVITLKEMDGENRIYEFIELCKMNNWIVNEININNVIDIHNKVNENIEWED